MYLIKKNILNTSFNDGQYVVFVVSISTILIF